MVFRRPGAARESDVAILNLNVQLLGNFSYGLAMKRTNDSRQGSLFLDGDLPSAARGNVSAHDRQTSDPLSEAPGDRLHMRIQRDPVMHGLFRRWWRRLVGVL